MLLDYELDYGVISQMYHCLHAMPPSCQMFEGVKAFISAICENTGHLYWAFVMSELSAGKKAAQI